MTSIYLIKHLRPCLAIVAILYVMLPLETIQQRLQTSGYLINDVNIREQVSEILPNPLIVRVDDTIYALVNEDLDGWEDHCKGNC